jgi:thiol-disulfide isomerase/thioredoxin
MSFRSLPSRFDPARPGPQALIVIGTDWCGYCQQFKPKLAEMEPKLGARVYWVDGDSDPRVQKWKVDGFPTVLYKSSNGGMYKYNGERNSRGIEKFINSIESI